MLTNFISEASHTIHCPVVASSASGYNIETIGEPPIIRRNLKLPEPAVEQVDIYDRAREIYYRARRTYRSRPANIL